MPDVQRPHSERDGVSTAKFLLKQHRDGALLLGGSGPRYMTLSEQSSLLDYAGRLEEQLRKSEAVAQAALDTERDALQRVDGLLEQLEAAQREIKQLRKALEHEVTARLLPPPVTERSHDESSPAKRPS